MLVNHADALVDGIVRRVDYDLLAVDKDFTFVWLVKPIEDVHQSGLASAVLTQKRQNLAFMEGQVDMIVG